MLVDLLPFNPLIRIHNQTSADEVLCLIALTFAENDLILFYFVQYHLHRPTKKGKVPSSS